MLLFRLVLVLIVLVMTQPPHTQFNLFCSVFFFGMLHVQQFTYTNPMHTDGEGKMASSPNEYGDDLAQHYDG